MATRQVVAPGGVSTPGGSTPGPGGGPGCAHWAVPVGRVEERGGLTYVYSPAPGGFSAEDYRRMPAAERIDLVDGVAVVRPDPGPAYRQVVRRLYQVLETACPAGLAVYSGGMDVPVDARTVFCSDLVVLSERGGSPLLAVDTLGDHGRPRHGGLTFRGYRRARVASYWVCDPAATSLTAYRRGGPAGYRLVGEFSAADVCALDQPFPVRFRVGDALGCP